MNDSLDAEECRGRRVALDTIKYADSFRIGGRLAVRVVADTWTASCLEDLAGESGR